MDSKFKLIVDSFGKERFKFNEMIKGYTNLGVGGPAKLFFIAFTTNELVKMVDLCRRLNLPFFLFGTGSKIMMSDLGFDGLVIKNRSKEMEVISIKGKATRVGIGIEEALVEVCSGVSMTKFAEFLKSQSLANENLENMPGSIGGNLFLSKILQNMIKSIKVLASNGNILEIGPNELRLRDHIILSAVFRIKAKN